MVQRPANILIVRLSAIGDIVFATPLIHALRLRYPAARIDWLVQPEFKVLLEAHPELDEVITWPRGEWERLWRQRHWAALWRAVRDFRRSLKARRYDLALDVQSLLKSGTLTWLSGAHERIGLGSREGSRWLLTRVFDKGGDPRRIGSEYLQFARDLGLPVQAFNMHIGLRRQDRAAAAALRERWCLHQGCIVICPFTTRPQKHWFDDAWRRLVEALGRAWALPVVMLGGPGDKPAAGAIRQSPSARLIDLVGETSLGEAAALIAEASLLIGVDTGLTHMGIAFDRPTIALFGSTCPYLDTTRDNAVVLYHRLPCSPCKRRPTCDGRFDCMRAIRVEEVMWQAAALLEPRGEGT